MKKVSLFLVAVYVFLLFGSSVSVIPAQAHYEEDEYEQEDDASYSEENCGYDESLCAEVAISVETSESENGEWDQEYIQEDYDCYEEEGVGGHFSDVCSYETNFYPLEYLYEKGIFSGNDGKFQKYKSLTRVELLKIAYKAKGVTPVFDKRFSFKDVPSSEWYASYVSQALKDKVVKGKDDRLFHPNDTVTKAEQLKIIFSVLGIAPVLDDAEVDWDIDQKHWVVPYLKAAEAKNVLIQDYSGESFNPDRELERIESVPLLFKLLVARESGVERFSWDSFRSGNFAHFEDKLLLSSSQIAFDYPKYMGVMPVDSKDMLKMYDLFEDISDMQSELRGMEPEEQKIMKLFIKDLSTFMSKIKTTLQKYMPDESIVMSYPEYDLVGYSGFTTISFYSVDKETFKKDIQVSYEEFISILEFFVHSKGIQGFLDYSIEIGDVDSDDAQDIRHGFQVLKELLISLHEPLEVSFGEPIVLGGNTFTPVHTSTEKVLGKISEQIENMDLGDVFEPLLEESNFDDSYLFEMNTGKKVAVIGRVNLENPDHVKILSSLRIK